MYRPLGQSPLDITIYDPTSTAPAADVSFVDPNINTPQPDPLSRFLTDTQNAAIRQLPVDFPQVLNQAKKDFYTFKAGVDAGLFPVTGDTTGIVEWFADFPRYWQTIRPNYVPDYSTVVSAHQAALLDEADAFAQVLGSDTTVNPGLGIGPLVIAGILVAAIAGVAGVIWAVGYVKAQNNISSIIEQTVAGKLPPEILANVEKQASSPGFLSNIGGILKWGAIGLTAVYLLPIVAGFFKQRSPAHA